jgi:hypothetical protein
MSSCRDRVDSRPFGVFGVDVNAGNHSSMRALQPSTPSHAHLDVVLEGVFHVKRSPRIILPVEPSPCRGIRRVEEKWWRAVAIRKPPGVAAPTRNLPRPLGPPRVLGSVSTGEGKRRFEERQNVRRAECNHSGNDSLLRAC